MIWKICFAGYLFIGVICLIFHSRRWDCCDRLNWWDLRDWPYAVLMLLLLPPMYAWALLGWARGRYVRSEPDLYAVDSDLAELLMAVSDKEDVDESQV